MGPALLEVAVLDPRDVPGAEEGGADRLLLAAPGPGPEEHDRSPEPALVSSVCRETELPVHVVLRLNDTWTTSGGELTRLVGLAEDYLGSGAAGVSFGFLDADLEVDTEVCAYLVGQLPAVPWAFGRAVDDTLDLRRSFRRLARLPGLVAVRTAGSPRGLGAGADELLDLLAADPALAPLVVPAGELVAEHVPWLVQAGVRALHLGRQARPGGSFKAYVDAAHVRSWRLLLDDAVERAERLRGRDAG
jgi:copper homeostasis protein